MEEIWRDIKGYENYYQVSNFGRVKSLNYNHTGKENILKPCPNYKGYLLVCLWKDGKNKWFQIHRLVAMTFIPNPENKPQVDHIDTNPSNNKVDNLRWCTKKENQNNPLTIEKWSGDNNHFYGKHHSEETKKRISNTKKGKPNEKAKKCILQYTKDGEFVREWSSMVDVEKVLGLKHGHISECCQGKKKSAYNYVWKYKNEGN